MKCPACARTLSERSVESITVDVCDGGCGGIWFDSHELDKVDNATEAAGEALLDVARDGSVQVDHNGQRCCPKCADQPMMRHFASTRREVEVDECPACAGIWLDAGELSEIRSHYATEEDRRKAFNEFFETEFGPQLRQMRAESEGRAARAQRFARIFRFICPTYYIPGKQEWGAF